MVFHISRDVEKASEKRRWRQYTTFDLKKADEKNVYLEKTKVNYKTLLVTGFLAFTFTRQGQVERVHWKLTSIESIYSGLVLSTAFCFNVYTLFKNIIRIREAQKFNDIFTALFNMFTIIPLVSKMLSFPMEMSRAQTYIEDWHKLQLRYRRVTGKQFSSLLQNFERKVLLTQIVSLTFPLGHLTELRFHNPLNLGIVVEHASYTFNALCAWQLASFWYINAHCVRLILKDLKQEIKQRLLKESRTTAKNTDELRFLWLSLSSLIQQLGTVFAATVVGRIFVESSVLIVSLYFAFAPSTIDEHESFDKTSRHHFKSWLLFGILLFFFNTGYTVRKSATEDFQLQLLSIRPTKEQRMAGFEFQIKVFLQSLRSFPPVITASGFFTITRRTFLAILSSAMTNFLIMEQFKLSERQLHVAKNHTHTTTPSYN